MLVVIYNYSSDAPINERQVDQRIFCQEKYNPIILRAALYGCYTWYPTLGKMVLGKISGSKREKAAGDWGNLQSDDQIKETSGECGRYGEKRKINTQFWWEKHEGTKPLEDLEADGG